MYHIGIVTTGTDIDWASSGLLDAAQGMASGKIIDPLTFRLLMGQKPELTAEGQSLECFDAFLMRGFNRKGETDYQYEILELLQQRGKLVINSPAALSVAESKTQTTFLMDDAGLPVPRTLVTQSVEYALDTLGTFGKAVLKPPYGSLGKDIQIVEMEDAEVVLKKFFEKYHVLYMQEYIPHNGKDIRAFVVGDEVVAAICRIAEEGQWRTNLALGGTGIAYEITPAVREMCIESARLVGLDYTGIDIVEGPNGPLILEVNGAPWWHGLYEATGRNVAVDIVRHVISLLENGKPARQPHGF